MHKISVCIVDDHNLFRKAIMNLIKSFQRVGDITEAGNGKEFIDLHKKKWPDVVLLDLEMPRMNGVETAEYLLPNCPDLKIIVLTQHDTEKYMLHMLEMGVHSFLLKNTNPDELERAIYAVVDKDFYHNDLLTHVIRKSIKSKSKSARPQFEIPLSDREREVVISICDELTHKQIAEKLSISEFTVRNHHRNILDKLGLKKTVGLVKYAYENGLLD
jgi:two-component system, NarL family, response regulator DegU